jgi:hypothetical protein
MAIAQAIGKAIEEGCKDKHLESIFHNPLFWQTPGKVMRWEANKFILMILFVWQEKEWMKEMVLVPRTDHLADRGNAAFFFALLQPLDSTRTMPIKIPQPKVIPGNEVFILNYRQRKQGSELGSKSVPQGGRSELTLGAHSLCSRHRIHRL